MSIGILIGTGVIVLLIGILLWKIGIMIMRKKEKTVSVTLTANELAQILNCMGFGRLFLEPLCMEEREYFGFWDKERSEIYYKLDQVFDESFINEE